MNNKLAISIFDPRGENQIDELQLAPRPSIQSLKEGKVLFFDNTKLSFCNYKEIFISLEAFFKDNGINNIEHVRQSVRGTMTQQMRELAAILAKENYTAAVVALADMGTSGLLQII